MLKFPTCRIDFDGQNDNVTESDTDKIYFECYSRTEIHATMIRDNIRTNAYRQAILQNDHLFKDKIVMDVGCGTGILSLFAAQVVIIICLMIMCIGIGD